MPTYDHRYVELIDQLVHDSSFQLDTRNPAIQALVHGATDEVVRHLFDVLAFATTEYEYWWLQAYDVAQLLVSIGTNIDQELAVRWQQTYLDARKTGYVPDVLLHLMHLNRIRQCVPMNNQLFLLLDSSTKNIHDLMVLSTLAHLKDKRLLGWIMRHQPQQNARYTRYVRYLAPFDDHDVTTLLLEMLHSTDWFAVKYAIQTLLKHPIPTETKVALFRERIQQNDQATNHADVVFELCRAVGLYGTVDDVRLLEPFVHDQRRTSDDECVGVAAHSAICHLQNTWTSFHPYTVFETSNDEHLRRWAIHGLTTLGPAGYALLYQELEQSFFTYLGGRIALLRALAHVPTQQARTLLETYCDDVGVVLFHGERVRDVARTALADHQQRWGADVLQE